MMLNKPLESTLYDMWTSDFFLEYDAAIREMLDTPINVEFLNPERAPKKALPYLAQLLGLDIWTDVFGEEFERGLLENVELFTDRRETREALNKFFELAGLGFTFEFTTNSDGAYDTVLFRIAGLLSPLSVSQQEYLNRAIRLFVPARIELLDLEIASGILLRDALQVPASQIQIDYFELLE